MFSKLAGRGRTFAASSLLLLLISCTASKREAELTVSAASDLMPAFQELGRMFEQKHGTRVVFNFGSTGQLAQQIEKGAPVDLFAAANVSFVDDLESKGLTIPETKALYAQGRLTLWTRSDSLLAIGRIEDLVRPEVKKIAIANPQHAPYGQAAKEALERAGIWDAVLPKLVYGENISQTLQFAQSGNVDAAIVALSLSNESEGKWKLVPAELHNPLNQALAVVKGARNEKDARAFAAFINGLEGRTVMRTYGFVLPGEDVSN
jgi:molybdate transport system substrate-binding protein